LNKDWSKTKEKAQEGQDLQNPARKEMQNPDQGAQTGRKMGFVKGREPKIKTPPGNA